MRSSDLALFLSAEPDTYYFTWQLELQVFNFIILGIAAKDIHMLLGYKPDLGLEPASSSSYLHNLARNFAG